jgi:hypothetical protein
MTTPPPKKFENKKIFKNPKDDVPKCKITKTSGKSTVSREGKDASAAPKRKRHPKIKGLKKQQPETFSHKSLVRPLYIYRR